MEQEAKEKQNSEEKSGSSVPEDKKNEQEKLTGPTHSSSKMDQDMWQLNKKKILERSQYAWENSLLSDCSFLVGKEPHTKVFNCHKVILGWASPVFQAMFYGGVAEKDGPVVVPDVAPEAFKTMLEYIYTDIINLTSFDLGCDLLYASKKYILPFVVEKCKTYLMNNLTHENVCRVYEFAKLLEEPEIVEKCIKLMQEATDKILQDSSFEDVDLSTLMKILEQKYLMVDSELVLIDACLRWARREAEHRDLTVINGSVLREILGSAFSLLRFLTLGPSQFASGPALSDLLTREESFAILVNLNSPGSVEIPPGICTETKPRRCPNLLQERFIWDPKHQASMYYHRMGAFENNGVIEAHSVFEVNKNIRLISLQVPSQIVKSGQVMAKDGSDTYSELIIASVVGSSKNLLNYVHFEGKVKFNTLVDIKFDGPVEVKQNESYTLRVWLHRQGLYPKGTLQVGTVTCGDVEVMFDRSENFDIVRSISFIPSLLPETFHFSSTMLSDAATKRKFQFTSPKSQSSTRPFKFNFGSSE